MNEIIVLWPKNHPYSTYEEKFAQTFCLKKIKNNASNIIYYTDLKNERLPIDDEKKVIVFRDPYTYLSDTAFKALIESCKDKFAVAPVYTAEANHKDQIIIPPFPYVDPLSFEEAARKLYSNGKIIITLDNSHFSCFSCLAKDFYKINSPEITKAFHTGALAHRFIKMFSSTREDLIQLLPKQISHLLDIGCAEGGLGKLLKKRFPSIQVEGVEISPTLAAKAKKIYDRVYVGKFEEVNLPQNFYDSVIVGDVLEHMFDPWYALKKIYKIIKPGGYLIGSTPNISHWSIIRQLLLGRFDYIPVGLLCVTHIRFFTIDTINSALKESGFKVELIEKVKIPPTPEAYEFLKDVLTHPSIDKENLLCAEILFRARKPP